MTLAFREGVFLLLDGQQMERSCALVEVDISQKNKDKTQKSELDNKVLEPRVKGLIFKDG